MTCTIRAGSPVKRMISSISIGVGPSASMMRARSSSAGSGVGSPEQRRAEHARRLQPGALQHRRDGVDHVARLGDQPGALLQEIVAAGGARVERRARHGEDLAVLLQREAGGDQRAGSLGRLHDDGGERHAGDDPVAAREIARPRLPADAHLADAAPLGARIRSKSSTFSGG